MRKLSAPLLLALAGCANTSQSLSPDAIGTRSATTPSILTHNIAQTNTVPTNAVLLDAGGLTATDVASSLFVGFGNGKNLLIEGQPPQDAQSVVLKMAQDAKFTLAEGEVFPDGHFTFRIEGYDGSGSAAITASVPMVQIWADLLRKLSEDERLRFLAAMDTVDKVAANAMRAALGVPVPR